MCLFDNILAEVQRGIIPTQFTFQDLVHTPSEGKYLINGTHYARGTLRASPPSFRIDPPGAAVQSGQPARVRLIVRGKYQLIDPVVDRHRPLAPVNPVATVTIQPTDPAAKYMNKKETRETFINQAGSFIDWLTAGLNEFDEFQHSWRARGGRHKTGLPKGTLWSCTSLFSAYQQYVWPASVTCDDHQKYNWEGTGFAETTDYLTNLADDLQLAIKENKSPNARMLCGNILRWGGVYDRPNVAAALKHVMDENQVIDHLRYTRDHLNSLVSTGFNNDDLAFTDRYGNNLRLDSGTTKIYALLCDSFIIHDGRVGSALGMLVMRWWDTLDEGERLRHHNELPGVLRFSYCGSHPFRRPLQMNALEVLEKLVVGPQRVAENIRATWLLEEVLRRDHQRGARASNFTQIANPRIALRALEAALFMVGYSINEN